MKIDIIAGARPNFMKIAPIIEVIENKKKTGTNIDYRLIHTGQHYDKNMSGDFFKQLNIPTPNFNLEVGSGTQSQQTAMIMIKYEEILLNEKPDLCLVVGDVNSTMACSIVAKKFNIKVAHVEAGIRSFDLSMPEEINRMVTDSITDYFFTTSITANENLLGLGINKNNIFFVGNTMIDTLSKNKSNFKMPYFYKKEDLKKNNYLVLTMHRPSNVDELNNLKGFLITIENNSREIPVIFPAHPRTSKILKNAGLKFKSIIIVEPMSYLEFNFLVKNSKCVITDSGGITEETTVMGIPCMTLRDNTERPETITVGTNELIGTNLTNLKNGLDKLFNGNWKSGSIPDLWDGNAAKRIVNILLKLSV